MASDHECESPEEVVQRLARGMYVFVRHGSAARNLPALLRAVHVNNAHRCCFCTDDSSPADLLERGHMDEILRLAVAEGLDPLLAVGMATLNGCVFYDMRDRGGIAPGWAADFCLVDDLRGFRVREVFRAGRQVAQEGRLCVELPAAPPSSDVLDTIHIAPLTQEALRLPVPSGRARVMGLTPQSLITRALILPVALDRGCFDPQQNPGLAKIAVVERHKATGKVGVGILHGYLARTRCLMGPLPPALPMIPTISWWRAAMTGTCWLPWKPARHGRRHLLPATRATWPPCPCPWPD